MLLEDAKLKLMTVSALKLSPKFADLIREGYSQDSFYEDEGDRVDKRQPDRSQS
jgi:hypothetical protein